MNKLFLFIIIFISACDLNNTSTAKLLIVPQNDKLENIDQLNIEYKITAINEKDLLINRVVKVIPCMDKLFVSLVSNESHGNQIAIYSNGGDLIYKMPHGRGSGEYISARDFILDNDSSCLYILSRLDLMKFDLNGNYIQKQVLPPANCLEFDMLDNGEVLLFDPIISSKSSSYFYLVNENNDLIEQVDKFVNGPKIMGGIHFNNTKDNLFCIGQYGNTVYRYNKDIKKLEPHLIFPDVFNEINENVNDDKEIFSLGYDFSAISQFISLDRERFYNIVLVGKEKLVSLLYDNDSNKVYNNLFEDTIYLSHAVGYTNNSIIYSVNTQVLKGVDTSKLSSQKAKEIIDSIILNYPDDVTVLIEVIYA